MKHSLVKEYIVFLETQQCPYISPIKIKYRGCLQQYFAFDKWCITGALYSQLNCRVCPIVERTDHIVASSADFFTGRIDHTSKYIADQSDQKMIWMRDMSKMTKASSWSLPNYMKSFKKHLNVRILDSNVPTSLT